MSSFNQVRELPYVNFFFPIKGPSDIFVCVYTNFLGSSRCVAGTLLEILRRFPKRTSVMCNVTNSITTIFRDYAYVPLENPATLPFYIPKIIDVMEILDDKTRLSSMVPSPTTNIMQQSLLFLVSEKGSLWLYDVKGRKLAVPDRSNTSFSTFVNIVTGWNGLVLIPSPEFDIFPGKCVTCAYHDPSVIIKKVINVSKILEISSILSKEDVNDVLDENSFYARGLRRDNSTPSFVNKSMQSSSSSSSSSPVTTGKVQKNLLLTSTALSVLRAGSFVAGNSDVSDDILLSPFELVDNGTYIVVPDTYTPQSSRSQEGDIPMTIRSWLRKAPQKTLSVSEVLNRASKDFYLSDEQARGVVLGMSGVKIIGNTVTLFVF